MDESNDVFTAVGFRRERSENGDEFTKVVCPPIYPTSGPVAGRAVWFVFASLVESETDESGYDWAASVYESETAYRDGADPIDYRSGFNPPEFLVASLQRDGII